MPPLAKGRTINPDAKWRRAVDAARENDAWHDSANALFLLLWQQGHGHKAAAACLDWFCSCHPAVIKAGQSTA